MSGGLSDYPSTVFNQIEGVQRHSKLFIHQALLSYDFRFILRQGCGGSWITQKRSRFLSDRTTVRVQRVAIAISWPSLTPNNSIYLDLTKNETTN